MKSCYTSRGGYGHRDTLSLVVAANTCTVVCRFTFLQTHEKSFCMEFVFLQKVKMEENPSLVIMFTEQDSLVAEQNSTSISDFVFCFFAALFGAAFKVVLISLRGG